MTKLAWGSRNIVLAKPEMDRLERGWDMALSIRMEE
jgi:hypothetical protein